MFQVLIADDELAVIKSLKGSIKWDELDVQLAGTAMNGYEAIGIVESKEIDIAILDIRMPGVNGLELCSILKEKNPEIQIIIISGYAQFEYAKQAIGYGVLGYCLKPLEYTEVTKYLLKAIHNLTKGKKNNSEDLLEALEESNLEVIISILSRYGFKPDQYYVAVSSGENAFNLHDDTGIVIRLGRGLWGYILKYNFFEEHQEAFAAIRENYGLGYLDTTLKTADIYSGLEQCSAMAYQYFVNENCKICTKLDSNRANVWLEDIQKCIQRSKWDIICNKILELKNRHLHEFTVRSSLKLCNMIYSSELFHNDTDDYYVYGLKQLVTEYNSLSEMLERIYNSIEQVRYDVEGDITLSNTSFLSLMKYVDQNYRGNITLASAAQVLHMNPNYISHLFKKEAGITLVHYITQKRLDDAKELLTTTQMTLMDIANEVGFNDYFYFLKTFKKFVGITPGQYRMKK